MDKLKKLNGSMIAAIVLSVLLIMSITTGATLAWFASRDSAKNSLVMGEAVVVTIGEDYKQGDGKLAMNIPVSQGGLLPGMTVTPNVKVQLQQSNTNALLRARFITTVEYPDKYVDAAYSDTSKYPNAFDGVADATADTFEGRVVAEKAKIVFKSQNGVAPTFNDKGEATNYKEDGDIYYDAYGAVTYIDATGTTWKDYKYQVFAGYMYYDYYNYLGQRLKSEYGTDIVTQAEQDAANKEGATLDAMNAAHTKRIHLNRVEVREEIAKLIGDTANKYKISGVEVAVTEQNAAELEIRQRGVDLTNAINRVLNGHRGYKKNASTGKLDYENGTKYTRRVADGWAYREADQAWYYMGSATNGFVLANQSGVDETPTTTTVAQDITGYQTVKAGNTTVNQPEYTKISTTVANDMSRNYLGGTDKDPVIDMVRNEIAVLNNDKIASIDLSQGNVSIDFLTKKFVLPTFIDNNYAKAKVTFTFTVEAVQDYLVDPLQEATSAADRLPNNLVNAVLVFNNAFPQSMYPASTDPRDKIRATGSTANVIPGGGSSVEWDAINGTTTIDYSNCVQVQGEDYSYGYLTDATMSGTDYEYNDYTKAPTTGGTGIKEYPKETTKVSITGFNKKTDEYDITVADYSKKSNAEYSYQRGTASSLGICPIIDAKPLVGA